MFRFIDTDVAKVYSWAAETNPPIPAQFVLIKDSQYYNIYDIPISKDLTTSSVSLRDLAMIIFEKNGSLSDINKIEYKEYDDISEVEKDYKIWRPQIDKEIEKTIYRADLVKMLKDQFTTIEEETPEYVLTPLHIVGNEAAFQPPVRYDGLLIFDSIATSKEIPFVKFVKKNEEEIYKVYRSQFVITADIDNFRTANSLIAKIWLGEDTLSTLRYNIENNYMLVDTTIDGTDYTEQIMNILKNNISINLGEPNIVNIKGNFEIWNYNNEDIEIYISSFLDAVTNDTLISSFLYMEESNKPFGAKRRMDLHYHKLFEGVSPASKFNNSEITFNFNMMKSNSFKKVKNYKDDFEVDIDEGRKFLKVNVSKANSLADIIDFMNVINAVMIQYDRIRTTIELKYNEYITEEEQARVSEDTLRYVEKEGKAISEALVLLKQNTDKYELIPPRYARKIGGKYPRVIEENEIDAWEQDGYQVMVFPLDFPPNKNSKKLYFVCEDEKIRYPGVFVNTLDNKKKYPYLPQCFTTDQIEKDDSIYQWFRRGKLMPEVKEVGSQPKTRITQIGTVLDPGRIGELPKTLRNMMFMYNSRSIPSRYGVIRSKSSLYHCVLNAIGYEEYIELETNKEREEYVNQARSSINDFIYAEVMKQELYYMNTGDIMENLLNTQNYLDPSLYYRALEEMYGVNIYVFQPITGKGARGKNVEEARIKLPSYDTFIAKSIKRERPIVLIYEHMGAEAQGFDYPQCELIVNEEEMSFGEEMNDLCFEILKRSLNTITWTKEKEILLANKNIYYNDINLPVKYVEQFLDDKGKMIGINAIYNGNYISIAMPPSQPMNLRSAKVYYTVEAKVAEQAIKDKPTSKTNDGLWYSFNKIPNSIFIPVSDVKIDLPIGPENPLKEGLRHITTTVNKYQHMANIMKGLIIWLYSINEYIFNNVVVDDKVLYNFSKVHYYLPAVDDINEALKHVEEVTLGTLVKDNKLIMRSMVMRNKLLFTAREWEKLKQERPDHVLNYYVNASDFIEYEYSTIFDGSFIYEDYVSSLTAVNNLTRIHNYIGKVHSSITHPFIYKNENNKLFLINNCKDLFEAADRALQWKDHKINQVTGKFNDFGPINYNIYKPNFEGKLTQVIKEGENGIDLITYEYDDLDVDYDTIGAAMLPL